MSPGEIRASFIFYIGAGAVASAGIIALARSLPTIVSSFASSLKDLRDSRLGQALTKLRTEDDLPISVTVGGSVILAIVLALLPQVHVNILGAILIVIFGFFFATVSSRICGQIGSSANPISGMTIAALLGTCLIFLAIGCTVVDHRLQAISIAAVVAVATAVAGNTSQDLKTGYLVGSTPRRQQIAILVGALGSALVVSYTLTLLNRSYTYPVPETHPAFEAAALAPAVAGAQAPVEVLPATMAGFRIAGSDSGGHASYQGVRGLVATPGVGPGRLVLERPDRGRRHLRHRARGDRRLPRLRRCAGREGPDLPRAGIAGPVEPARAGAVRRHGCGTVPRRRAEELTVRVVSLLPAATEIVAALGAGDWLVGVSHECDYPPAVQALPRVTRSTLDPALSSGEIDRQMAAAQAAGTAPITS